ncbi:MAG: DUF503 domain-containing protein [Synergistetes bacterium]|nr:DUF503 domain-containing protein [Synergistota bacterium]
MLVGILEVHLRLFSARTLKEKRTCIQRIIARLRNSFNVSVAEIGKNDKWRECVLGIAIVGNERAFLDNALNNVLAFLERQGNVWVEDWWIEIL